MRPATPSTNVTLLVRVGSNPADPLAWEQFVFLYGPYLVRWCRDLGLQDADAHDVAQEVLMLLARRMAEFTYDPAKRFRSWLRTIAHNAWCDYLRRRRPWNQGSGDTAVLDKLAEVAAGEDLVKAMERQHDHDLFSLAMSRVARRVEPRTFEAFRLIALERLPGAEAADRLGMKVGSTYAAKAKVLRLIREEVEKLDPPEP